jgi:hypothetical protein
MPGRDPSVTVSSSRLPEGLKETLFRSNGGDLFKEGDRLGPLSGRGGSKFFDSHLKTPFNSANSRYQSPNSDQISNARKSGDWVIGTYLDFEI